MDQDFGIDLEEIGRVIDTAEVFIIRLAKIDSRLLIDMRAADGDPPRIAVVPPVSSAAERYRYLQQLRPGLPLPDHITVFSWPRQIEVMRDVGVWQRIEDRLVSAGGPELHAACEAVLNEVMAKERAEVLAAIRGGEGFETIWQREPRS